LISEGLKILLDRRVPVGFNTGSHPIRQKYFLGVLGVLSGAGGSVFKHHRAEDGRQTRNSQPVTGNPNIPHSKFPTPN